MDALPWYDPTVAIVVCVNEFEDVGQLGQGLEMKGWRLTLWSVDFVCVD